MITVFTPAYNRASLLPNVYESLTLQRYNNFEWIIVDDGSTDGTDIMIQNRKWTTDSPFPVRYIKKENGGKHTAINRGVKEAKGELFLILDSDDTLPDSSLEIIAEEYERVKDASDIGGVCGLMSHHNGKQIGSGFPYEELITDEISLIYHHNVTGDLLEVFKTDVMREFPFPEFPDEKFCPEQLVWFRIAQKYKLRCFNKVVYFRDYLDGGLTDKITRIRHESPKATCMCYKEMMMLDIPMKFRMRALLNYLRFKFL